jgi:hypothetical protein
VHTRSPERGSMGLLRPRSPLARPSAPRGPWHSQPGGQRQRAGADRAAHTGPPRGRTPTRTQTFPRCRRGRRGTVHVGVARAARSGSAQECACVWSQA